MNRWDWRVTVAYLLVFAYCVGVWWLVIWAAGAAL